MLSYHHYIQLASLLVQVVLIKKNWPTWFRFILILTCVGVAVELTAFVIDWGLHKTNAWLYNLYTPLQGFLILSIFIKVIETSKLKSIAKKLLITYFPLTLISFVLHPGGFYTLNDKAIILSLICNGIAVCIYYIDTMRNDIVVTLSKQSSFYYATSILLLSALFICRFAFWSILQTLPNYQNVLSGVIILANTFMYGGFIMVFVCQKKFHTK